MKKIQGLALIISIIILTMSFSPIFSATRSIKDARKINNETILDSSITPSRSDRQDGRYIEKLQWYSPNGELPGTYQQYIRYHPLIPAIFSTPEETTMFPSFEDYSFSILVDTDLYPEIEQSINQYIADIELEGHTVFLQTVTGGTPEEIKEWIIERNDSGSDGILLVGDITAAWAEVSESAFPCDLFYMDLDGNWEDNDQDGDYEVHIEGDGDMGPELYVGRIYAHSLTYDSESNMVNDYFTKAHAYRAGELTQPWRGLEYVEEDWYDMDVNLDDIYGDDVVRYDFGYFTTAQDYLNQMDLGQHFVQVCAHSYSGGHHFGTRPTESASYAHIYVYNPVARSAKLLLGSNDGIKVWLNNENVYTNDRYGSWHEDDFEVDVTLNEGWNQLLCKISQRDSNYEFSACFTDLAYNTLEDLTYQINNPALYDGEAEYVRSWLLNGFHQDSSENFWDYLTTNYLGEDEASINPNDGDIMGGDTWTTVDYGNPYTDMSEYCHDADYGVCYAFARVFADTEKQCQLWMGYDDGARVWLNGKEKLNDNRYGEFFVDMTKINVTLHYGENRLLMKISEWMGNHGFTACFSNEDGSFVDGLSFDPEPTLISHIGTWLINGAYANANTQTRLSMDYLGDEGNVTPSEGDSAPLNTWERGIGNGCPFDLNMHFDHGDWVLSQDIQDRDPPVLFYNLFSCGPGRFTDENYLAGAYIFHTTYGLITIASSKSGSMLNFNDFTRPLGEGKCIGEAFYDWFDAQAPFQQWEKEWYYGMVVNGDPTLCIPPATQMKVLKPENAIYLFDHKLLPFFVPIAIGKINIETFAFNVENGIDKVEFYMDDELKQTVTNEPYAWMWNEPAFFRHNLRIVAYDTIGRNATRELTIRKFL